VTRIFTAIYRVDIRSGYYRINNRKPATISVRHSENGKIFTVRYLFSGFPVGGENYFIYYAKYRRNTEKYACFCR
jgi:hypothetical protein